jgi:hypothetical protein
MRMMPPPVTALSKSELHDAARELHGTLCSVCVGLPHAIVDVVQDDRGMFSLMLYGVEQAYEPTLEALKKEIRKHCENFSPRYTSGQTDTLNEAFRIIAQQAGVEPARMRGLQTIELLSGMLVIMFDHQPLAGSDDPIHLYAQALTSLKKSG